VAVLSARTPPAAPALLAGVVPARCAAPTACRRRTRPAARWRANAAGRCFGRGLEHLAEFIEFDLQQQLRALARLEHDTLLAQHFPQALLNQFGRRHGQRAWA